MAAPMTSCQVNRGHILNYGNILFHVAIQSTHSKALSVEFTAYYLCNIEKRLKPLDGYIEDTLKTTFNSPASILDCKQTTVAETQLEIPFVLIGNRHENDNDRLKLLLIALLPICNKGDRGMRATLVSHPIRLTLTNAAELKAGLSDGPVIYWTNNKSIYLHFLSATSSKFITMKATVTDNNSSKILATMASYDLCNASDPIVGYLLMIVHSPTSTAIVRLQFKPLRNYICILTRTQLQPSIHSYICRASAVGISDQVLTQSVAAETLTFIHCLTSDSELIEFHSDGTKMKVMCKDIPVTSTNSSMSYYRARMTTTNTFVILQSTDFVQSCVVDLSKSEVVRTYKNVSIFSGDFLHLGIPLLLIVSNVQEKSMTDCTVEVDDLLMKYCLPSIEEKKETDGKQNFAAAVQALQIRAIAGREAVSRSESKVEHIQQMLHKLCCILSQLALGVCDNSHVPCLLQLLNEIPTTHSGQPTILKKVDCHRPVSIEQSWQRVCNEQWIIGFKVVNISESDIWDFHLVLTSSEDELTQRTKVLRLNKYLAEDNVWKAQPHSGMSKPGYSQSRNRIIAPSEQVFLMSSFEMGIIKHRREMIIRATLTFKHKVVNRTVCGSVSLPSTKLSLNRLMDNTLRVNLQANGLSELLVDMAALDASTDAFQVTLSSQHSILDDLSTWLKQDEKLRHIPACNIYWNNTDNDLFTGIWLDNIHIKQPNNADMTIHSKNTSQFFAFIHHLYAILPEDVLIIPPVDGMPPPNVTSCMSREVSTISEYFTGHSNTNTLTDWDSLNVENAKAMFHTLKRHYEEDESNQLSNTRSYRTFRKKLVALENMTDKVMVI